MTNGLSDLQDTYKKFIDERDWSRFHTPKNLAMSISIEASELEELFQWHDNLDVDKLEGVDPEIKTEVKDELADIILYCLSMADKFNIDINEAVEEKLEKNKERFNLETSKEISRDLEKYQK